MLKHVYFLALDLFSIFRQINVQHILDFQVLELVHAFDILVHSLDGSSMKKNGQK